VSDFESFTRPNEEIENNIILKGKVKAVETSTYGLFMVFFNEVQRTVEKLIAVASHYSSLYEIDTHLPWYTLEEYLANLKWKGDIAVNISIDLQNYLENSLDMDRGKELFSLVMNNESTKIESLLQAILIRPFSDRYLQIETDSEIVSKKEMEAIKQQRNRIRLKKEKPQPAPIQFSVKGADIIDVDLVLAPVSGIPIQELSIGERIMVKISSSSTLGDYYIDSFGARIEGNIIPVAAQVVDIKRGGEKEYYILCKLGENVYGKAIESEPIKLKKYDELLAPQGASDEMSKDEESTRDRRFVLFVSITGGLMFALLLLFLILWLNNYL
jgi:hypothetical protein